MYQDKSVITLCAAALLAVLPACAGTPLAAPPKGPLASSFPGPLWSLTAPQGGTASVSQGHLFLNVPGGRNHDALLAANQAVRLTQAVANGNFDVSIKLDSQVVAGEANTSQGLMVLADAQNFLTFAVDTDGTRISLSAHAVTQGAAATLFAQAGFAEYQNPLYLRLRRSGSSYLAYYSVDGNVWTQAGSFTSALAVTAVGPFAGNSNANPSRAVPVVMAVNWFHIL